MTGRERELNATFVALTDTLVGDFDANDLMYRLTEACVDLLGADAAGILLADAHGTLRVLGSSSERLRLLELFELQNHEGPCLDAHAHGVAVHDADLAGPGPWPDFRARAVSDGFRSVHALPMRLRTTVIGALNILRFEPGGLGDPDLAAAQALTDVATIALIQDRTVTESRAMAEHLRRALNGQVAVEQAKGMLAERSGQSVGEAFELMRAFARRNQALLVDVASRVLAGDLGPADFSRRD